MAYTLSQLIVDCLRKIGKVKIRTATGGGTTSVIDSSMAALELEDGVYIGSTVFIVDTTDGLTPKGKWAKVSAFTASSGTFTTSTYTDAVGAGDKFAYITSPAEYVIEDVIHAINAGLRQLGTIDLVDTTTLTGVGEQTEYAASVAWKYNKPKRIDIQSITTDSDNNQWVESKAWDWIPSLPGASGLIIFKENPPEGNKIRVWYEGFHPEVALYSDVISETIHPTLAITSCLEQILFTKNAEKNGSDATIQNMYNHTSDQLELSVARFNTIREKHKDKGLILGKTDWREGLE